MRNKLTALLIALAVFFTSAFDVFPAGVTAHAMESAAITFEKIPDRGVNDLFITGNVILSGGATNYNDYRITAYLQVQENGQWWGPKPSSAAPHTAINSRGRFLLQYASFGQAGDLQAIRIQVFLYPAGYNPPSHPGLFSPDEIIASALIARNTNGTITVDGELWDGKPDYSAFDAQFPNVRKTPENTQGFSINYSPFVFPYRPGGIIPPEWLVRQHLEQLAEYFDSVRFFTAETPLLFMYDIAHELGLRVMGTAWLNSDTNATKIQMDNLIKLANEGKVTIASVGSETLYRRDFTPLQLLEHITYVKNGITAPVPVTTMDVSSFFDGSVRMTGLEDLQAELDIILFSHYPIFSNNYRNHALINEHGGIMGYAIAELNNAYNAVKSMQGLNKPCILAEAGWSTSGPPLVGSLAVPSMENSRAYWNVSHEWAKENNLELVWFSAYDEHWKPLEGGLDGRHWGVFYENAIPKEGFTDLFPFSPLLNFNLNGGEFSSSYNAPLYFRRGTTITLPTAHVLSREGHRFAGWFYDNTQILSGYTLHSEITLHARWEETPENFQIGDTGRTGRVTSADATRIARYLLDNNTEICVLAADLNGDGTVDLSDLILLVRWLSGFNVDNLISH